MRLCISTSCTNLTWARDRYGARNDGKTEISSRYWITEWSTHHVELAGKTAFAMDGVFPAEGTFTGKISPAGNSVLDGQEDWRIGYSPVLLSTQTRIRLAAKPSAECKGRFRFPVCGLRRCSTCGRGSPTPASLP